MAEGIKNVYQFKITLRHIMPKIWRRIQVPENYNFKELHLAIQCAMGWFNGHMHFFRLKNSQTGEEDIIEPDWYESSWREPEPIDEETAKISDYFIAPKAKARYEYDMGDGWEHDVLLEKIVPAVPDTSYPKCLAGRMACPPEDCGGIHGYGRLVQIMSDPQHPDYEEKKRWLGGDDLDPRKFDPKEVDFNYNFMTLMDFHGM